MELRNYQKNCFDATMTAFQHNQSVLNVLATGTGKTIIFSHIAKEFMGRGRIMSVAHRSELIYQGQKHLSNICNTHVDIEMGDNWASRGWGASQIVKATVQSLIAGRDGGRMTCFEPNEFSLLIIDECFPPGTLVDGKPIEQHKVGDTVRSVNHYTGEIEDKKIVTLFKKQSTLLVEITLENGKTLVCTPNHPIFTLHGYKEAGTLTSNDMVLTTIKPEKGNNYGIHNSLSNMRNFLHRKVKRSEALLKHLLSSKTLITYNGKDKQKICFGEDEEKQSNEKPGIPSQSFHQTSGNGLEATGSRRKRERPHYCSEVAGMCVGMGNGSSDTDKEKKRFWLSILLQGRYWKRRLKDRCRSGRKQSQSAFPSEARRKENRSLSYYGVESVKVLERGSSRRFEQLCPGCYVYNLEVEDNNNYFAEDVLVHNCHHATSTSYKKVIDHFKQNPNIKILGVTATPDRTDEMALGQIFDSVAFEYDVRNGIDDGWLTPIEQLSVFVKDLDFSGVRTNMGDLNGKELAEVMEYESVLHGIASPCVELCGDKKTLIFAASVAHAERLTEIINRSKPDSARFVCGTTPKDERAELFDDYRWDRFQYLVNVGVATEGFDEPNIQIVVMARPTKSRCLYTQMAGRGTRPVRDIAVGLNDLDTAGRQNMISQSVKPKLMIIDFVGNCGRHKLVTSADILGGKYEDEVVELAKDNAQKKSEETGLPVDIASELEQAEQQLKQEQRKELEQGTRKQITPRVKYSTAKVNPFDIFDVEPVREREWSKGRQPTPSQINCLKKAGVDPSGLSFTHAHQMIDQIVKQTQDGKPTFKMLKNLKKHKFPLDFTYREAGVVMGALAKNNWRPLHDGTRLNVLSEISEMRKVGV